VFSGDRGERMDHSNVLLEEEIESLVDLDQEDEEVLETSIDDLDPETLKIAKEIELEEAAIKGPKPKPTLEEVCAYAQLNLGKIIRDRLSYLSDELQAEAHQTAFLRVIKAYDGLDAAKGWRAYIYLHCRGAVMDYDKGGKGNEETKWSLKKKKDGEHPSDEHK